RSQDPDRATKEVLSDDAARLYDLILRTCCGYVIEVVGTLPNASVEALPELLKRERKVLDQIQLVLERLPSRRTAADFEWDYRQLVANRLDHVEFFGATLSENSLRYPLDVAYLSLTVDLAPMNSTKEESRPRIVRIDDLLAKSKRIFV